MSPSIIPQGSQVTGAEGEFEQFVQRAVQDEVAKLATLTPNGQVQNQPAATPINVQLNGQNFQFTSQDELNAALNNTFTQYNQRIAELQNQPQAQAQQGAQVTGNEDPDFSLETFVNKMTSDPREAFNYVDKYRFGGVDPAQAIKDAAENKEKLGRIQQSLDVYRFRDAHPEFRPEFAPTVQAIIQQTGLSSDYNGIEAAYSLGITRGLINPGQAQPQFQGGQPQYQPQQYNPQTYPPFAQQNPYGSQGQTNPQFYNGGFNRPASPPALGRTGGTSSDAGFPDADSLSPDQIEAIFSRFQA